MRKPIIAITMGDAAGIGPEIVVKSLAEPELTSWCTPVVLGDRRVLDDAAKRAGVAHAWQAVQSPRDVRPGAAAAVIDYGNVDPRSFQIGVIHPALGDAAVRYTREAA